MRRWLARLAFSCVIVGAVLAWEGYKTWRDTRAAGTAVLYGVAAAACVAAGGAGFRERHKSPDARP
jgi:hypothetical protein